MKYASSGVMFLVAVIGGVVVAATGQSTPHEQKVRALINDLIASDNRSDLETVMSYYVDDAVWLPPNEDILKGKAGIRKRYEMLFQNYKPNMTVTCDDVVVKDHWAFAIGTVKGNIKSRTDERTIQLNDVYMMILQKSKDDKWQVSRLMWHSAAKKE